MSKYNRDDETNLKRLYIIFAIATIITAVSYSFFYQNGRSGLAQIGGCMIIYRTYMHNYEHKILKYVLYFIALLLMFV